MKRSLYSMLCALVLAACGGASEGDECETDADCGDMHCHFESDDDAMGVCEAEDEHDHTGDDHDHD